ncbi:MAG: NADH-quinone oxidoreductase subunit L, partial [Ignavibacteriota bacterium]
MFRAVYLTFYGKERFDAHHHPPHEVGAAMWIPLVVLAALSVLGGFLGVPHILGGGDAIANWLEPIVGKGEEIVLQANVLQGEGMEIPLMIVSVVIAIAGILLATRYYKQRTTLEAGEKKLGWLHKISANKFYVDELYDGAIVQPTYSASNSILYKFVDVRIIDGIVNGSAAVIDWLSGIIRKIQTGIIQNYAVMIVVGILVLVSYVLIF